MVFLDQRFLTWVWSDPRDSVSQFKGWTVWESIEEYEEEEKNIYIFSYDGFDECMYGTCVVLCLRQGKQPLS